MKKFILCAGLAVATAVGFTACSTNTCYTCSISALGISSNVDICDGQYTTTTAGISTGSASIPNGLTEEEYKNSLESAGYSCSTK